MQSWLRQMVNVTFIGQILNLECVCLYFYVYLCLFVCAYMCWFLLVYFFIWMTHLKNKLLCNFSHSLNKQFINKPQRKWQSLSRGKKLAAFSSSSSLRVHLNLQSIIFSYNRIFGTTWKPQNSFVLFQDKTTSPFWESRNYHISFWNSNHYYIVASRKLSEELRSLSQLCSLQRTNLAQ